MKLSQLLVAAFFASIFSSQTSAAVSCVKNQTTGQFESKSGKGLKNKSAENECSTMNLLAAIDIPSPAGKSAVIETIEELHLPDAKISPRTTESHAAKGTPGNHSSTKWNITLADKSVRGLLERWCREADYQLLWEISVDLQLGASATLSGTFEDALSSVMTSLSSSEYPVEAMIYDNRVVRVVKHTPRNK